MASLRRPPLLALCCLVFASFWLPNAGSGAVHAFASTRHADPVVATAATAAVAGDDQADAISAVERALRAAEFDAERCIDALNGLGDYDSQPVAELLLNSYVALEAKAQSKEKQAHSELTKGDLSDGQIIERRGKVDPLRRVQARLLDRVTLLRTPAALLWLVERALGDDKLGLSFKVELVRTAGFLGEPLTELLQKIAPNLKKQDDWMALLLAAQALGPRAKALAPGLIPQIDHAEATMREAAALALAKMGAPGAIEPLVMRLEKESGRTQLKLAAALEILTSQKHGLSLNAWKSWFAVEGLRYTSGQAELGVGVPAVQMLATGYFHGIPQDSRAIVYVIDCSGSMVMSMTNPKWADAAETRPVPAPPGEVSRMEASKQELIKALGELPPETRFNIVYFSSGADRWVPKLVDASPDRVKKAQKWVAELGPGGATNIHDAMENAFAIAGRAAADKYYETAVDTVFLLTDGQPSLTNGPDNPERTLQMVRRLNPFKKVVVHAIGLGKGIDDKFLSRLAAENGGVFVQR